MPNPIDPDKARLAVERFTWRTLAEELLEVCETFASAQDVIDRSGFMDNYEDAARARKRQAKAIGDMRRIVGEVRSREIPVVECTGVSSGWCPIHGDCTCIEGSENYHNDDNCPLHSPSSSHAEEV